MDKNYSAVIFDMDGTIFDSEIATRDIWISLQDEYGIKNIEIPYKLCIGVIEPVCKKILLDYYGANFPVDRFYFDANRIYEEKYHDSSLPLKPGVFEVLSYLKDSGKMLALASSSVSVRVKRQLKNAGILDYFDGIVGGDMITKSKPDPEIYLKACEALKVEPSNAFAIEDSYPGICSAFNGGLRPIMVPDILPANDEMRKKAECVLSSLIEVRDYLKGL